MRETPKTVSGALQADNPSHPGQFVRDSALTPKKLTVSAAAKLVGVGRPALSNFLNGHVAATPEMASRIEIAFGIPSAKLLDMQATYDVAQAKNKTAPVNALPYVAPFLSIKATEIEAWVDRNISSRTRLSVFLRTLANSTGNGIKRINFPGNDDAEEEGWDGYIDSTHPTPWIPDGLSGWEFGTNKEIKTKADGDFVKSIKATPKEDRDQTTFIFATPRHWPGKAKWVKENKGKGQWKDVRAYDSSDLEQWLEQSIAGQAWFANETQRPSRDVRTLDKSWAEWADVTSPPLSSALFAPAIEGSSRTLLSRLTNQPGEPTLIAADSIEEALAFLAQIFGPAGGEDLAKLRDRVLVFDRPGVLPQLAQGTKDFIAVATNREVEREFGPLARQMHTIAIYPRNAPNAEAHLTLEPLNYEAFRTSLEGMGYTRDDITKYSNESGRSLTVLRRRLSTVPAVRTPGWAEDHTIARDLIPFMFIGAWSSTNTTDQTAVTLQANVEPYENLEKICQRLVGLNDPPIWSVGTYRGVISKLDLLFTIASLITKQDLERYFVIAEMVLGEDDPKLDLPESDQWAAAIHGKSREFSATLREGISETLVLLAVHGNNLFQSRLGFDCESAVRRLVRTLLTPLKTRILEANSHDLAAYAEAAPDEFLSIIEEDLRSNAPESYGLMRPVDTSLFGGGSSRSGLLWALEGLAWNPETLPRTVRILGQLSGIEIHDNLVNKPIHSLESIFRSWMPQTAASYEQRLNALKLLAGEFPQVAWKICTSQLHVGHQTGHYSHKPRWRTDAHGFGEPVKTRGPVIAFALATIEMVLNWKGGYTREMLGDLIYHLHSLSEEHQAKVWDLVRSWAEAGASDADKAFVREKIRVTVMSRRGMIRSKQAGHTTLATAARSAYMALEPVNLLRKHEWLFQKHWVEESADELEANELDFERREKRITKLRIDALREVLNEHGLTGIIELAELGEASFLIGLLLTKELLDEKTVLEFLLAALPPSSNNESWTRKNLISGALHALEDEKKRSSLLNKVKRKLSQDDFVRILLLAPFRRSTWKMVDELGEQQRQAYWSNASPDWIRETNDENREAVSRLLDSQRPRAAFACVKFKLETIGPDLLFRLLAEMARGGQEKPGQYQLEQYYIEQAIALIDKSPQLTLEQKAGLEFTYIDALSRAGDKRGKSLIPNLEKYVETHPELFVQAIVWTYKRRVEGDDPPEWKVPPERIEDFAERGYKLIEAIGRMPGHDDLDVLQTEKLAAWVKIVRDTCAKLGRLDIGDICLGKLLSAAPIGDDGVWPCEPVRQVMEDVHSKHMMEGAHTGLYNSRGVVWRGEGGAQERELADKYRAWAHALQYSHPFVASQLLMEMVKTYEHEATQEDMQAAIRKRLR